MSIPSREQAEFFLDEAASMNPGPWVPHSFHVARAAEAVAAHHPLLDSETAYVIGCLHDIGRRFGVTGVRHILDGYRFLHDRGFEEPARICLTHSYPIKEINSIVGEWDCLPEDKTFMETYISSIEYDQYDRLIQLCDCLALPSGFCLVEKRLVDVALRYGVNQYSVLRWNTYLALLLDFEQAIGRSVYSVLPGVVENTFGFSHFP
jgi:hypothetical protein